jgi:hypothetical protein
LAVNETSAADIGVPINSQSLGRIVAGGKTKTLFISFTQRVAGAIFISHSEAGFK